ncbi:ATP-binding cassette sub-family B member 8, mitochondrial-like [Argonauta hians]
MLINQLFLKLLPHRCFDIRSGMRATTFLRYMTGKPFPLITKYQTTIRHLNRVTGKQRLPSSVNKNPTPIRTLFSTKSFEICAVGFSSLYLCKNLIFQVNCESCRVIESPLDAYKRKITGFNWRGFYEIILPDMFDLLCAILSAMFAAYLNIQIPLILGDLVTAISSITQGSDVKFSRVIKYPVMELIVCYILQGASTTVFITLLSRVGEKLAARLRLRLFESIMMQDMEFFDRHTTGELIDRLTTDVQDFKSSFKLCISQGLKSVTQTVGCVGTLFIISPKLTWVLLGVVPTLIGIGSLMGSFLRVLSRQAQDQSAQATAVANEAIGNIRTVRAFSMEENEIRLYDRELEKSKELALQLGQGIGIFQGLSNLSLNGVILGILVTGGQMLASDSLTAGNLMSFLVATQTIQRSLAHLSVLWGQAVRGMSAEARIFEFINLPVKMVGNPTDMVEVDNLKGNVAFKDVSFTYPTRLNERVLENLNLEIPKGTTLALVGMSGSGKSTIASLLERFYDVDAGKITIDNIDIKGICPKSLRTSILGMINQEPVLFNTSIMENIRYGKPTASDKEVFEAAKVANAHNFILTFTDGYNTIVGERGIALSGGQKQRIAIARALIKNPKILILDEATSALDTESEQIVQDALEKVSKGRTVLVIAHRLSTVKGADTIAVISNGKVIEIGDHKSLIAKNGVYFDLVMNQNLLIDSHRNPTGG